MRGLVTKSTGSWYQVLLSSGEVIDSRIKGKFRTKGITTTNPVAIGDEVEIESEPGQRTAVVTRLYDRRNYIIRKSVNLSKQAQIIAANIDQAFLLVTLASPRTSLGFIDRFLVTAEAYDIPAALIFNKIDLFSEEGFEVLNVYKSIYEQAGYPSYEISALHGTNLDTLKSVTAGKITLVSGHSGAGKSTLINQLIPGIGLKTTAVSEAHDKGMHTTTFAELHALPAGGFIADTPGIRELGIIDIEPAELGHFFPEIRKWMSSCRFYNCRHVNEPGCAVIAAVENGALPPSRYDSYLSIYHGQDTRA
jgi:ribosome biogenesis GTPase